MECTASQIASMVPDLRTGRATSGLGPCEGKWRHFLAEGQGADHGATHWILRIGSSLIVDDCAVAKINQVIPL